MGDFNYKIHVSELLDFTFDQICGLDMGVSSSSKSTSAFGFLIEGAAGDMLSRPGFLRSKDVRGLG